MSQSTLSPVFTNNFSGKTAIVTGAASGIGEASVNLLENMGADVIQIDNNFRKPLSNNQINLDISDFTAVQHYFSQLSDTSRTIDYCIHAAAILIPGGLLDYTIKEWQQTFLINTCSAFHFCQQVGRHMAKSKRGSLVVIGSNCARTPRLQIGAYAASKAATHQMLKCLGLELAEFGVRCNIVAPGSTDTQMQRKLWHSPEDVNGVIDGDIKAYRLSIPLRKIATPESIARTAIFLLSDSADHMTLQEVTVDGGATLGF